MRYNAPPEDSPSLRCSSPLGSLRDISTIATMTSPGKREMIYTSLLKGQKEHIQTPSTCMEPTFFKGSKTSNHHPATVFACSHASAGLIPHGKVTPRFLSTWAWATVKENVYLSGKHTLLNNRQLSHLKVSACGGPFRWRDSFGNVEGLGSQDDPHRRAKPPRVLDGEADAAIQLAGELQSHNCCLLQLVKRRSSSNTALLLLTQDLCFLTFISRTWHWGLSLTCISLGCLRVFGLFSPLGFLRFFGSLRFFGCLRLCGLFGLVGLLSCRALHGHTLIISFLCLSFGLFVCLLLLFFLPVDMDQNQP